jgi:serine/threonine-protein kinase
MAPEQWRGSPRADHRLDLYALGATLYEMLTGALPAVGVNVRSSLARRRPGVPDALAAIVGRALEKDPEARFADAHAFREALLASAAEADEVDHGV